MLRTCVFTIFQVLSGCHLLAGGFIVNLLCLPKLLACLQKKEELDSTVFILHLWVIRTISVLLTLNYQKLQIMSLSEFTLDLPVVVELVHGQLPHQLLEDDPEPGGSMETLFLETPRYADTILLQGFPDRKGMELIKAETLQNPGFKCDANVRTEEK